MVVFRSGWLARLAQSAVRSACARSMATKRSDRAAAAQTTTRSRDFMGVLRRLRRLHDSPRPDGVNDAAGSRTVLVRRPPPGTNPAIAPRTSGSLQHEESAHPARDPTARS